jgi:flagella basal body P-ring formation protein FlgA
LWESGSDLAWYVKPSYTVTVQTPVATTDTLAGHVVDYEMGVADLHDVRGTPVGQGTWRARTSVQAGTPITLSLVAPLPDAPRGEAITLVVTRGTLRIEADGELLNDAHLGDSVRALNHATHATVRGILVQPDIVEVQ